MPDDPPNRPLDGFSYHSSGPENRADAALHREAWTWLHAQVDRLGRDPDVVPLLPREEVEESVQSRDLEALTSHTRRQLGVRAAPPASAPTTDRPAARSGAPSRTEPSRQDQLATETRSSSWPASPWRTAVMAGGLVLLLVAGLWGGGRLTQPSTQPLASLTPYQDAVAFIAASPPLAAKSLTDAGVRDLRTGVRALQAAAPHPLNPVARYDASRAQDAAVALASAHRALASLPPSTSVHSSLFAVPKDPARASGSEDVASGPLRDNLDTTGELAAFAALLAAKAYLMQGDVGTAEQWLRRVQAGTSWHDDAQQLGSQILVLRLPD